MRINNYQSSINFKQSTRNKRDDNPTMTNRVIVALMTTGVGASIGESLYRIDKANIQKTVKVAEQDKVDFYQKLTDTEKASEAQQNNFKNTLKEKIDILNAIDCAPEGTGSADFKKVMFQLNTCLYDKIESANEGKQVIVPNCIMLTGQNTELNSRLINHLGKKSDCNFIQVQHTDNILTHFKNAEQNHTKTGKRTLLHVQDFDKLINPATAPSHVIADLKNLMGKSSDKYHTTVIFSTQGTSNLDSVALQPHRVEKVDVNISDADYEKIKPIMQKMEDLSDKVKPVRQKIEESTKEIVPISQKIDELKEKLKPIVQKAEEYNTKLKNHKRTKLIIGILAGLAVGTIGVELFRIMNKKESN